VNTAILADGARWFLVLLFSLAILEKTRTLSQGSAAWHPLMVVSRRRRQYAGEIMGLSLVVDIIAFVLLLVSPIKGALLSAFLILGYSLAALGMHRRSPNGGCHCFWNLLNTSTRRGLLIRNGSLLVVVCLVLLGHAQPSIQGGAVALAILGFEFFLIRFFDGALQPARDKEANDLGSRSVKDSSHPDAWGAFIWRERPW
jgi:hypothetical protein